MTTLLAVAGTLIGLPTLSSGALREAVLADEVQALHRQEAVACVTRHLVTERLGRDQAREQARTDLDELVKAYPECSELALAFDERYVIAYGLFFTGILALAFAPTLFRMRRAGEQLRDRSFLFQTGLDTRAPTGRESEASCPDSYPPRRRPRRSLHVVAVKHLKAGYGYVKLVLAATKKGVRVLCPPTMHGQRRCGIGVVRSEHRSIAAPGQRPWTSRW